MASGSKDSSVFTGNSVGGSPGDSDGLKKTSMPGGTMLSAYPQDNIHGVNLPNTRGGKMAGSDTNLSHSLSGASAVQRCK
jgi:hypothetical protein